MNVNVNVDVNANVNVNVCVNVNVNVNVDVDEGMSFGSVAVLAQGFFMQELCSPRDVAVQHGCVSFIPF